jgi:hypothetical protein
MRTRLTFIVSLVMLLVLPRTVLALPVYIGTSPLVPPTDGAYLSPQQVHAEYVAGALDIVLQDIVHSGFTNITRTFGVSSTTEQFNSIVVGNISINGGSLNPISLSGLVSVILFGYTTLGQLGTFNTEMVQLDLSGSGVLIRESPTLASTGQTKIEDIGGGLFRITSFFDVFTELSLDGGQNWIPSTGSTHVDLTNTPLPAALPLFATGLGALGLLGWRSKRRRAA